MPIEPIKIDTSKIEAEVAALQARMEANDQATGMPPTTITRGQVRAIVAEHISVHVDEVTDQLYDHEATVAKEKQFAAERAKGK